MAFGTNRGCGAMERLHPSPERERRDTASYKPGARATGHRVVGRDSFGMAGGTSWNAESPGSRRGLVWGGQSPCRTGLPSWAPLTRTWLRCAAGTDPPQADWSAALASYAGSTARATPHGFNGSASSQSCPGSALTRLPARGRKAEEPKIVRPLVAWCCQLATRRTIFSDGGFRPRTGRAARRATRRPVPARETGSPAPP
jgi:hypothetical protein